MNLAFLFVYRQGGFHLVYRLNEIALAVLAIVWGCILMLPGDLFEGIERYKFFNTFAPDTAWGAALVVCGLIILIARPEWAHINAHAALCIIWLGMTALSLASIVTAPSLLITSLLVFVAFMHATKFWRLFNLRALS